jgi:glycosidase
MSPHAPAADRALAGRYEAREADWRNGCIVYQVLVDRFAPSQDLEAKRSLYPAPKTLRRWDEEPRRGHYVESHRLWSHEIEFWGGDLASLSTRLDHLQRLGADVLYLNPICHAFTNHKYDALDYRSVSPEYGTRDDVVRLADELHRRGLKLVLDGVFNHMGRNSPLFRRAQAAHEAARRAAADPTADGAALVGDDAALRDWFVFGDAYPGGARSWWGAANLPELNLENPAVREHLWGAPDSVVRGWLRDGIDGWRLDVAFDIGFNRLQELTDAAHAQKPGSLVVGEIANYPDQWIPSVDGAMLFGLRRILLMMADGQLDGATAGRMITRLVDDLGVERMLPSWVYLDNHDTPRQATVVPDERRRRVAQVLQFTLPGSPNLYYGSEVGMTGGDDPEMRGPMRWDLVEAGHPQLAWTQQLIAMRKAQRALRIGDFRTLVTREVFGFERYTDRALDAVLVLANPSARPVQELVLVPDAKLMDGTVLEDLLGQIAPVSLHAALLPVTVPAHTTLVLKPVPPSRARQDGYDNYKRVP